MGREKGSTLPDRISTFRKAFARPLTSETTKETKEASDVAEVQDHGGTGSNRLADSFPVGVIMKKAISQTFSLEEPEKQLDLWKGFFAPRPGHGYTLDLWESMPKFVLSKQRATKEKLMYEKPFWYQNIPMTAQITAAILKKDDEEIVIFPGAREHLVFQILVQLAAANYKQEEATSILKETKSKRLFVSVDCSLRQIRTELAELGHAMTTGEIKEALNVLSKAHYEISGLSPERATEMRLNYASRGSYISSEIVSSVRDPDGSWSHLTVVFNPIASRAILAAACWPIDDRKALTLPLPLARWLTHRLSHNFRQAAGLFVKNRPTYSVSLSTILLESGIQTETRQRDNIARIRDALTTMKEKEILESWTEKLITETSKGRPKLVNVTWQLLPSIEFTNDIIDGNRSMKAKMDRLPEENRTLFQG